MPDCLYWSVLPEFWRGADGYAPALDMQKNQRTATQLVSLACTLGGTGYYTRPGRVGRNQFPRPRYLKLIVLPPVRLNRRDRASGSFQSLVPSTGINDVIVRPIIQLLKGAAHIKV
jgi:hypothetical protein